MPALGMGMDLILVLENLNRQGKNFLRFLMDESDIDEAEREKGKTLTNHV